jgi:hypothetical protein
MKLTVAERICLLQILPTQGDFLTIKRLEEARSAINLTEDESTTFGIVIEQSGEGNKITWKENGSADIQIGEVVYDQIVTVLKKMNEDKTLESKYITLYEKFVEKKDTTPEIPETKPSESTENIASPAEVTDN